MNCQKGDLARVISTRETIEVKIVDKIVICESSAIMPSGNFGWRFKEPLNCGCGRPDCFWIEGISDSLLRPIRDQPGEDETLQWSPVPKTNILANLGPVEIKWSALT